MRRWELWRSTQQRVAILRVVARLEAGMEMFLDPDDQPLCTGPELYANEWARTTIFKRHQGRVYFPMADRIVALVDGRLFCARDAQSLDRIVELMNKDPATGGSLAAAAAPRDVMQVPADNTVLWAGQTADVCGLAVGTDGLVVLHEDASKAFQRTARRVVCGAAGGASALGRGAHRAGVHRDALRRPDCVPRCRRGKELNPRVG